MPTIEQVTRTLDPQAVSAKQVTIYVRRGENDQERTIAFRIPEGLNPIALLDEGFGIDGNQAIFTVSWVRTDNQYDGDGYYDAPFQQSAPTLSGALNIAQVMLVTYLRDHGFEPKFA